MSSETTTYAAGPPDQPDPLVHAPVRLRLLATLTALPEDDAPTFPRLAKLLEVTPGNLTSHLRSLESAGYVATTTTGRGRSSVTTVVLTATGRSAFAAYRRWALALLDTEASDEAGNGFGGRRR